MPTVENHRQWRPEGLISYNPARGSGEAL